MNVRFFNVKLLETYLALEHKDQAALYFIQDAQRLYQGDKLIGVGAEASEVAAGLLSAEGYAKLQQLIVTVPTIEERLASVEGAVVGGVHYKGSVPTVEDLPANAAQGDMYEVEADGSEWVFNGEKWFEYGTAHFVPVAGDGIAVAGSTISVKLSADENNSVVIGSDGGLFVAEHECDFTAEEKAQLSTIPMMYVTEDEVDNKITRAIENNGIVWEELDAVGGQARIGNTYYTTIQQAFAAAKPGDTINVSAGTYEFIEFTKSTASNLTIVGGDGVYFKKVRFANTANYAAPDNLTFKNITFNGEGIAAVSGNVNNLSIINGEFANGAVIHTNAECSINGLLIRNCKFGATNSSVNAKEKTAILMQSPAKNVVILDNNIVDSEHNAMQITNAIGSLTIDGNAIDNVGSRAMRIIAKDGATLVIKDNVIKNANTNPAEAAENNGEIIKITGAVTDGALIGNTYGGQAISFVDGIGKV